MCRKQPLAEQAWDAGRQQCTCRTGAFSSALLLSAVATNLHTQHPAATTQDMSVFGFYNGDVPAAGLEALLSRYRELVPCVKAANLISFAPAIYQARTRAAV